jgi:hypothetical protein
LDAVLTKKGRELLATNGGLNITSFALADDEVDYTLYQPNHPRGSAYYDVAIRNTPILEAVTDETQLLKHKLVTLSPGITSIPVITLGQTSIVVMKDYKGASVIIPSTNPAYNTTLGYTAILSNKNVGSIIGQGLSANSQATIPVYIGDLSSTTAQVAVGLTFQFVPNSAITTNTSTRLTIIGNESGGSISIPVTVLATTISESTLSQL